MLSLPSFAKNIPLEDLSKQDFEDLLGEFSANFNHSTVTSASKLGMIFGFQFGVVGGLTKSDKIDELMKEADSNSNGVSSIPTAALIGKVTAPFGVGAEVSFVPSFDIQGLKMKNLGLALTYDIGSVLKIPVGLGIKATYTKTDIEFETKDPSTGADIDAVFSGNVKGLTLFAGRKFIIVEPYVGLGIVKADGDLSADTSLFSYSSNRKETAKKSSAHVVVGANLNLLALKLGVEYSNLLGTSKVLGKLNFGF